MSYRYKPHERGFRKYYDATIDDLINEELSHQSGYWAIREAKDRLRMYANLFNRDMRKEIMREDSVCAYCGSNQKLNIDHILAICLGGKNERSNIQILCFPCNKAKSVQEVILKNKIKKQANV